MVLNKICIITDPANLIPPKTEYIPYYPVESGAYLLKNTMGDSIFVRVSITLYIVFMYILLVVFPNLI